VCSVVKAELFYGVQKSVKQKENIEKVHKFLDQFVSLSFDDKASEKYGEIRADLEKTGTPIGPNDLLIASIALANNVILVTHNTREFKRVKGLKIEDWEK
jgi:tRNA(fMet)-specific endonuclease VapC